MKYSIFGAFAMACAATAFIAAQTPSTQMPSTPTGGQQSSAGQVTMSGCVTPGMTAGDALTLSGASIVNAGSAALPAPGQPQTTEPAGAGTLPPIGSGAATGATGLTGTAGSAGAAGTTGSSASSSMALNSNASTTAADLARGYRLSGSDVSAYAGKRVQIVGGFVPTANAAGSAGAASSGVVGSTGMTGAGSAGTSGSTPSSMTATLPEFQVLSVTPIEGPCPPR